MTQKILITGTSTGFGRLMTETLARQGHHVFATMRGVTGKNESSADALKALSARESLKIDVLELDVTRPEDIARVVSSVQSASGSLDVLVNNAGIFGMGPTEAYTEDQLRFLFETNVVGVHALTRAFLPMMRKQKSGLIINVSSGLGRLVLPGAAVYVASKFALEALTEAYRYDLAEHGIDVVSIEPGAYGTEITGKAFHPADLAKLSAYPRLMKNLAAVGQALAAAFQAPDASKPQEVADLVLHLVDTPSGKRPLRVPVGKDVHAVVSAVNKASAECQRGLLNGFGFGSLTGLAE